MNFSSIAVFTTPEQGPAVRARIEALPWAEVFHADAQGRLIVVVEGVTTEEEIERVQVLKRLEGVLAAEMVAHCFDEEEPGEPGGDAERIQDYLNGEEDDVPSLSYYQRLKRLSNH